jgi:dephospho-CoA kinase
LSKWSGKYVIGLTGNIATGKSVVRRMLEHLGAYGIDADALGHRAMSKGAPGHKPVLDTFGRWVLAADGEIDRRRLGKIVFSDPEALAALEARIHPLVSQAVDIIVQSASQPVIVIEAIKLMETTALAKNCDSLWVSYAPADIQMMRLLQNRHMDEATARQRILAQPSQEAKLAAADVVIKNVASFEDTWRQVVAAWKKTIPAAAEPATTPVTTVKPAGGKGEMTIERGRPSHSVEIAALISRLAGDGHTRTGSDIMAAFGEKAFLLLKQNGRLAGVIGWQVENLVARTTDVFVDPSIPLGDSLPALLTEMERASRELQCEASLLFIKPELARHEDLLKKLGYERRTAQSLSVQAWQEAAGDSMPAGTLLFFKQLRVDRGVRPI